MKEREARKNSVIVREFCSRVRNLRREIQETLFAYTGAWIIIKHMIQIASGVLIKLHSWGTKRKLMKSKHNLRDTKITIEDDLTFREKEVQSWIEEEVKRARRRRLPVTSIYLK